MLRKRILFVGEDLALWEQLQNPFPNPEGPWDVAFAKSGLQALASMSQSPCDAIVADMAIPGMCDHGEARRTDHTVGGLRDRDRGPIVHRRNAA